MEALLIILAVLVVLSIVYIQTLKKKLKFEKGYNSRLNIRFNKEKQKVIDDKILLGLLVKQLSAIIVVHSKPLRRSEFPFKVLNIQTEEEREDITAVRFKKTDKGTLVYINGAMVPTEDKLKINQKEWVDRFKYNQIERLHNIITMSQTGGPAYTENLKAINNALSK